jgi:hypothetical protein
VLRNNYIQAKHTSHAVLNLVKQIQFLKYKFNDESNMLTRDPRTLVPRKAV